MICDSLVKIIDGRIINANTKPDGLGRQILNVKPITKPLNLTYGDFYDEN